MTRRDRVLCALVELTSGNRAISGTSRSDCFTTDEIAQFTGILRTNCSAELNTLVRQGRVKKIQGRPTLYCLAQPENEFDSHGEKSFSSSEGASLPASRRAWASSNPPKFGQPQNKLSVLRAKSVAKTPRPHYSMTQVTDEPFDWGVATERSLHDAVQHAKMALTYPPHGMHVLLLGETGVGKSTFSRKMHEFALQYGVLESNAPFVAFNCSEYANNQEILLDQLFGHVKGAYTGAHGDKPGLVDQANGGMLFLDEVHRLPPQGQEMLFHLLDYGTFRRLGETGMERRSRVLLVAATTESPESALLSTFRRRIPVVIRLPALRDWTLYDRYELVYSLCRDEAQLLGMPVQISAAALDTLLFSRFSANIGDLKNTVKLACARAYNEGMKTSAANPDDRVIFVLPEHVMVATSEGPNGVLLRNLAESPDLIVTPDGAGPPPLPILEEGSRYSKLDRLSQTLYELGFDTEEILGSLERELHKQDQSSVVGPSSVADLRQFVGEPLFSSMLKAWREVEPQLNEEAQETSFLRIAVHLYGVIRSGRPHNETVEGGMLEIVEMVKADAPQLYECAGRFLNALSGSTGITLPEYEKAIVAMLLRPMEGEARKHIGLVVALFGESVARHLVDTAARLAGGGRAVAVDIPFQTPIDVMDSRLFEVVQRVDEGKGVLVLTDIPRFAGGGGWQPPVQVEIERVLRPDLRTVVTALQGIHTDNLPVGPLAEWIRARNQGVGMLAPAQQRVVWGCCLTGKGTARAVERLIREALPADLQDRVLVIPKELGHADGPLVPDDGLVATVGSIDPGIFGVPFFSVETLLTREGIEQLLNVLYLGDTTVAHGLPGFHDEDRGTSVGQDSDPGHDSVSSVGKQSSQPTQVSQQDMDEYIASLLRRDLVFVNPDMALDVATTMWEQLRTSLSNHGIHVRTKRETFARFCLHTAYVIERLIKHEEMVHPYRARLAQRYPEEWTLMKAAWQPVTDVFRIPVNENELAYLFELVFAERELEVFDG